MGGTRGRSRVRPVLVGLALVGCLWALSAASTAGAEITFYCDATGCYEFEGSNWVKVAGAVAAQAVNDSGGVTVTESGSPLAVTSSTTDTGNLLANDTGLASDPSAITAVSDAKTPGGVTPDANGLITIDGTYGTLTLYTATSNGHSAGDYAYNLDSGSTPPCGSDSDVFTYTLADAGSQVWSTTATLTETLTVACPPSLPTSKDQCKNGGWQAFHVFKNQGDCVSFVATGGKPASPAVNPTSVTLS
jgi:hypothetical protein